MTTTTTATPATAMLDVDELSAALLSVQIYSASSTQQQQPQTTSSSGDGGGYDRWTLIDDSKIDYGYLARTGGDGIEREDVPEGYYLTTAINYTNGPGHIGHAYESATSDVIARYHRSLGEYPVYFVTGADEHGQKIANVAAEQGKRPIDICDLYVTGFQVLNQRLLVTNDDYIRTTSHRHKQLAQELWMRCSQNEQDIYLDTYMGWYNVKEEAFVTDNEAQLLDYKCPQSGQPLKRVEEESYFFRMSKYKQQLIDHITHNPEFIQPEQHRNFILARLRDDELRDLSISRTTFSWGIPVPEGFSAKHVMYVWMDALSNYLTGVNGAGVDTTAKPGLSKFWPANVHIIGKDILWFHTVIWPCLLMSAKLPLPKSVFAHGFVNDKDGKKMSKSLGNVVDPHDMLDRYDVDTFRWYLCKEAPYGGELSFSEDSMRDMHNADLADTLGNLVHRATNLCGKFCDGVVPDVAAPTGDAKSPINMIEIVQAYKAKMNKFELQGGANVAIQGFRDVNGYLQEQAPWAKKGDENKEVRQIIVRATLEAIYALAHLLLPFVPVGAKKIFKKLNTEPVSLKDLDFSCRNLKVGTKIDVGDILYAKALSQDEMQDAAAAAANEASGKKKESFADAQKRKKEAKAKNIAKSAEGQAAAGGADDANQSDFTKVDIRVGKIVKVWNHPDADKLFCEQIDVGDESGPREIASGLREFYALEEMQDKMVLVVCNLKASKMVGFESNGMVLAAKSADGTKVELVSPPSDAKIGERVFIPGLTGEPVTSTQMKKRKVWDTVAKKLVTGDGGVAMWDGKAIETSAGQCKAPTLVGAPIS